MTSDQMIKLRHLKLNTAEQDAAEVFEDKERVFVFQQINTGISLSDLLDLKGSLCESETRQVLACLAFVIRVLYNHRTYPELLRSEVIHLQFRDARLE